MRGITPPLPQFSVCAIIALMASSLLLAGCDFGGTQSEPTTLENPYSYVGDKHSAGLDYALNQLKDSPEATSRKALLQLAERSSRQYVEHQGLGLKRFDAVEVGIDAASSIASVSKVDLTAGSATRSPSARTRIIPDSLKSRLSGAQLHFIDRIMELIENEPSVEELRNALESLNEKVRAELKEDRARVVLIASAVAMDSWTYWTQNGDEWIEAIREKRNSSASAQSLKSAGVISKGDDKGDDFSWSEVGKADIAGGVGGAAGGAVSGAMAGGIGAGPGAAAGGAGGAVAGSVGSATDQLLDKVW